MTDWKNRIIAHGSKPASQFQAHPNNWRKHPMKQRSAVKGSLDSLGWVNVVIENITSGHLIDGHERVWDALQNNDADVPFIQVELTEAEEAQALLSLDAIAALAETDREQVNALLEQVNTDNADVMQFLADFAKESGLEWGQPEQGDAEPEVDMAAELQVKWKTETGQLWSIGNHRLLIGDSTKNEDFAKLMQDYKARLIWTDPPYGVSYGDKLEAANPIAHRVRQIENDNLPADQLEEFIRSALKNAAEYSIDGAAIYVACPAGTPLPALIASFAGSGFDYHWGLVWLKDQIVLSRADYHFKHENILYGWKPGAAHYFTPDRTQPSVFEYPRPKRSDEHPTMKPVALVQHMVENSSENGNIVLDMFGGSGTTMIACQNTNRLCRMMELAPTFAAVVLERMSVAFPGIEIQKL